MREFTRGRYTARIASSAKDVEAAQRLRYLVFIAGRDCATKPCASGPHNEGRDQDHLDPRCTHMMVEDRETGELACCFRMLPLKTGAEIDDTYSAQYYDLNSLRNYPHPMVEMGRFCIHPDHRDSDVLRVSWGAMTRYVDEMGVQMLFGCSSFEGVDADAYMDAFALLKARHLAPECWQPQEKSPRIFPFAKRLGLNPPDMKKALGRMPPLLRTYLAMGGWVSDHAVVDNDLNTLHVFTGVEISRVPPARARALRAT
ncbi:MAG: GNAT family N-acetyltransferase [Pikeienuella sp.]